MLHPWFWWIWKVFSKNLYSNVPKVGNHTTKNQVKSVLMTKWFISHYSTKRANTWQDNCHCHIKLFNNWREDRNHHTKCANGLHHDRDHHTKCANGLHHNRDHHTKCANDWHECHHYGTKCANNWQYLLSRSYQVCMHVWYQFVIHIIVFEYITHQTMKVLL